MRGPCASSLVRLRCGGILHDLPDSLLHFCEFVVGLGTLQLPRLPRLGDVVCDHRPLMKCQLEIVTAENDRWCVCDSTVPPLTNFAFNNPADGRKVCRIFWCHDGLHQTAFNVRFNLEGGGLGIEFASFWSTRRCSLAAPRAKWPIQTWRYEMCADSCVAVFGSAMNCGHSGRPCESLGWQWVT